MKTFASHSRRVPDAPIEAVCWSTVLDGKGIPRVLKVDRRVVGCGVGGSLRVER